MPDLDLIKQGEQAMIGIGGPIDEAIAGIERIAVGTVEMIPVAAPDHPLALAGRNAPGAGRDHIQLVLTDRSGLTRSRDLGVIGTQTGRLTDLGSLLKEGIGWGYMPDMPELKRGSERLYAIHRTYTPPRPAGSWLIARFSAQATPAPEPSISALHPVRLARSMKRIGGAHENERRCARPHPPADHQPGAAPSDAARRAWCAPEGRFCRGHRRVGHPTAVLACRRRGTS